MMDDRYIRIIRKSFPHVERENIKLFSDGWDHDVLLVNGETAFRFPRRKDCADKLPVEVDLLNAFYPYSPVTIPQLDLHSDSELEFPFVTYRFIKGKRFSREVASLFSDREKITIAAQLGDFLSKLHTFPLNKLKSKKIDKDFIVDEWSARLIGIRKDIFPLITDTEKEWTEKLILNFLNTVRKSEIRFCVIHADIAPEHIIINPKTHQLAGVIDFGDVEIGDPAYDFGFLGRYGQEFLNTVYNTYQLPRDEYFDARRQFYNDKEVVTNLLHSISIQDQDKVLLHRKQLHDYIVRSISRS